MYLSFTIKNQREAANDAMKLRVIRATPSPSPSTTDDTPDMKQNAPVMLDIPDELFGNSFTLITNISKVFSDLMMVSGNIILFFIVFKLSLR